MGTPSDGIVTLVERTTRYLMLLKIASKDTKTVTTAIATHIRRLPEELRKSLTWDRGSELSAHKQLAIDAGIEIYFWDPASPWQRGSNENPNGLLRQYFPEGEVLSGSPNYLISTISTQCLGSPEPISPPNRRCLINLQRLPGGGTITPVSRRWGGWTSGEGSGGSPSSS
jgi:IS30 family transposase